MSIARVRIGKVHMKSGGSVHVLPVQQDADRRQCEIAIREALDAQGPGQCAGYAFVVWGPDGASVMAMQSGPRSMLPSVMVPDFVRNRLRAGHIAGWATDDVAAAWGWPVDSDDPAS